MARQTLLSSTGALRSPEFSSDATSLGNYPKSQNSPQSNQGSSTALFQSLLNRTVVEVLEGTGASAAAIALAEGANGLICRASVGANSPGLGTRVDVESGLSGECVRSGWTLRCDDADSDARVNSAACRQLGIRSIVATPIQVDSEVVGIIEAFSDKAEAFWRQDVRILEHAARAIVEAIAQRRGVMAPPTAIEPEEIAATPAPTNEVTSASPEQSVVRRSIPAQRSRSRSPVGFAVILILLALGLWSLWPRGPRRPTGAAPRSRQPVATTANAYATMTSRVPDRHTAAPPAAIAGASRSGRNNVAKQSALVVKPNRPLGHPAEQIQVNQVGPETQSTAQTLREFQAPNPAESLIFANGAASAVPPPVFRSILEPSILKPPELRTSTGIEQGALIRRVEPSYPPMARSSHIQGAVVLEATISRDGTVRAVRPVTGNAVLVNSAVNAVKQWRYTPYKLNGQPLDVQTRITLNFALP